MRHLFARLSAGDHLHAAAFRRVLGVNATQAVITSEPDSPQ